MDNLLLEYAAFKLKDSCTYCSLTRFYKLMYFLNKELKQNDVDIELPYYWYNYGVVVDKGEHYYELPYSNYFADLDEKIRSIIDKGVLTIKNIYQYEKTDKIVSNVYNEAPFEFQIKYRKLLKLVEALKENEPLIFPNLTPYLRELTLEFPDEEFSELYPLFLEVENIVGHISVDCTSKKKDLIELVESFWKLFCKKLRILENENISPYLIDLWEMRYKKSLDLFESSLFDYNLKFYNECYKSSGEHKEAVKELQELANRTIWE